MTSMRTLAAQPPMKKASTRAFIGFVACCTEGSLLKKNGRSLESKKMRFFLKEKKRPASVSLTLIQSFIQHQGANENVAFLIICFESAILIFFQKNILFFASSP